jgi:hypothetical protein
VQTNIPGDSEDSDEELGGDDGEASASEAEGDEGDEGERADKEDGGGKVRKSRGQKGGEDYDFEDAFIDDSEFVDLIEHADRRKTKYGGFFIAKGTIDRCEEMLPGAAPAAKAPRKRKAGAEGAPSLPESSGDFDKVSTGDRLGWDSHTRDFSTIFYCAEGSGHMP